MPVQVVEQVDINPLVISEWRVDGCGGLEKGTVYKKGSVLEKKANGNYELITDAKKANAILLKTIDATNSNLNAPILIGGTVDKKQLVVGGTLTINDVIDVLREKNIYLK